MTLTLPGVGPFDLSEPAFWARPPAEQEAVFAALRRDEPFAFFAEPVLPHLEAGPGYYAVVRHADVEAISSAPADFCSGRGAVSIVDLPAELQEFYGSLISMDDPRHAKIRRIVSRAFTPRMLEAVVEGVGRLARDIVCAARDKALAGDGTFDLVREVAAPLPLLVICDLMGVPPEDHELVFDMTNVILSGGDPEYVESPDVALTAFLEAGAGRAGRVQPRAGGRLAGLTQRLAVARRARPTADLTSALVNSSVDGERLSEQEIASFFILLCVAGNETTRTAISHGVLALAQHPAQRAAWQADPGLTRTAVDEIVRWASPVRWMRRTATRDLELAGRQFHAGDKLVLFYSSANRDEAAFADPYAFDIARTPNPHLGFGAPGPHFCLGAHLARREIAVAFAALFADLPDPEVVGEPARLQSSFVNGIKRMTVRIG